MEPTDTKDLMIYSIIFGGVGAALFTAVYDGLIKSALVKRAKKRALIKELSLFKAHATRQLDKIKEYKEEYLKHQRTEEFYYYFALTNYLSIAFKDIIAAGLLYDFFSSEMVENILKLDQDFSMGAEQLINKHIDDQKKSLVDKKESYQQVKYWEDKFTASINEIENLINFLTGKSSAHH